jgi:hypothetical protein
MPDIVRWLRRVPVWVWLFLAATQILTVVGRLYELPHLDGAIEAMNNNPAKVGVKSDFEDIRRERRRDLIGATILGPIFLALAYWACFAPRLDSTRCVEPPQRSGRWFTRKIKL